MAPILSAPLGLTLLGQQSTVSVLHIGHALTVVALHSGLLPSDVVPSRSPGMCGSQRWLSVVCVSNAVTCHQVVVRLVHSTDDTQYSRHTKEHEYRAE